MLRGIEGIKAHVGFNLGKSSWLEVNQEMIDSFARETEDRQWIYVDPQKARQGPFGTTVAQGYLTLGLVAAMLQDIYVLEGVGVGMHYGIDNMRFPLPVPVNASIRLEAMLKSVTSFEDTGEIVLACTVECDATQTPVMHGDIIYRFWPEHANDKRPASEASGVR
ncbi:MaoC family dehydratase [Pseudomonas sp. G5(2012)]|uniref:MaoC family dehydratase n=1 Tax=Pseudomonas sp. G5(2012) TaxID=1268068 RepID=UPI000690CAAE|nr:MaoC family dehydratase [Pseudomonas sp. G5(2012)]